MNGDGASGNDLIYIPRNTSEMNFVRKFVRFSNIPADTMVWTPAPPVAAWDEFINQDPYLKNHRGEYAPRNAIFLPVVARADPSVSHDISRNIGGKGNSLNIR